MANSYRSKTKKRKDGGKQAAAKISVTHCPEGMSFEDWQRGLRRLAAEKESFGIYAPEHPGDSFIVSSAKSGSKYRVEYYGPHSGFNRCECMDFKTSRLGTCKHIEAVSLAANGRFAAKKWSEPDNTYVYVDYVDGRKIKIRRGKFVQAGLETLISEYFNADGVIKDAACDPSDFIRKADALDSAFVWEEDALNLVIEARAGEHRQKIIEEKYAKSDFGGLLRTRLMPYQADGVRFAFSGGRTINADEMGLGKTVQAIATAELLKREGLVETVVVICPTSLKYQWLSEIKRFTESSAMVVEGDLLKRRNQLNNTDVFYKICSFHAMANNIKAGFMPEADLVIYDELQRLKNRETKMGKLLRKMRSQYVLALSGTPLENRLDELYSVTQFVDQYLLGPLYKFNDETTIKNDLGKVTGYQNLHSVADKLSNILIRRRKADVKLQMPSRTDTNLFVPLTKEQRAMHDDFQGQVAMLIYKWRRQRFLSENDRKRLLLHLSKMRMVCDSTFILDQKSRHDTKVDELMAIIANLLSNKDGGKAVIFSQWERMLRILAQQLEGEGIDFCFLHGGVPSEKRKDLIDRFREDHACRIFLSTDAGATGLNLQSASLLVNVDLPWNPAVLEQRIARIYRLGQENPVQIINMVASDTIEERMLSTLDFKSNMAAGILDGGADVVFFENKKFNKIIEVVDDMFNAGSEDSGSNRPEGDDIRSLHPERQAEALERQEEISHHAVGSHGISKGAAPYAATPRKMPETPGEIRDLVAMGMAFIGQIAEVLRKPQSAQVLADVLVSEDPDTGQANLNIPVPDKSTVVNILSSLSALLNK